MLSKSANWPNAFVQLIRPWPKKITHNCRTILLGQGLIHLDKLVRSDGLCLNLNDRAKMSASLQIHRNHGKVPQYSKNNKCQGHNFFLIKLFQICPLVAPREPPRASVSYKQKVTSNMSKLLEKKVGSIKTNPK